MQGKCLAVDSLGYLVTNPTHGIWLLIIPEGLQIRLVGIHTAPVGIGNIPMESGMMHYFVLFELFLIQ